MCAMKIEGLGHIFFQIKITCLFYGVVIIQVRNLEEFIYRTGSSLESWTQNIILYYYYRNISEKNIRLIERVRNYRSNEKNGVILVCCCQISWHCIYFLQFIKTTFLHFYDSFKHLLFTTLMVRLPIPNVIKMYCRVFGFISWEKENGNQTTEDTQSFSSPPNSLNIRLRKNLLFSKMDHLSFQVGKSVVQPVAEKSNCNIRFNQLTECFRICTKLLNDTYEVMEPDSGTYFVIFTP